MNANERFWRHMQLGAFVPHTCRNIGLRLEQVDREEGLARARSLRDEMESS
jgi:hypothetical protein